MNQSNDNDNDKDKSKGNNNNNNGNSNSKVQSKVKTQISTSQRIYHENVVKLHISHSRKRNAKVNYKQASVNYQHQCPQTALTNQKRLNQVLTQDNYLKQESSYYGKQKNNKNKSRTHTKNKHQDNPKINPKLIPMISAYCPRILTQVRLKKDQSIRKFNQTHFKCEVKQNFIQAMVSYFFQWKKKVKIIFQHILKDISGQNDYALVAKYGKNKTILQQSLKDVQNITKQCEQNIIKVIEEYQISTNKNGYKKITQNTNMMRQPMSIVYTQQNQKRTKQKMTVISKDFQSLKQYIALLMKLLKQYENFIQQANQCLKLKSKDKKQEYLKQIKSLSSKYHKIFNEIIDVCLRNRYHQFIQRIQFKIKKVLEEATNKYLKVFESTQVLEQVQKQIQAKFNQLNQYIELSSFQNNFSSKSLQNIDEIFQVIDKNMNKMHIQLVNQQFLNKRGKIIQKVQKLKCEYGVKLIPCIMEMFKMIQQKMKNQSILIYLKHEGALYLQLKKCLLLIKKLYQQMKNGQSANFTQRTQVFRLKVSQKLIEIMQFQGDIKVLRKEQQKQNNKQLTQTLTLVYLNQIKVLLKDYQITKQQIISQLQKLILNNTQGKNMTEVAFILKQAQPNKNNTNQLSLDQQLLISIHSHSHSNSRQDIINLNEFIQLLEWTRQTAPFLDIFQLNFWHQNDIFQDQGKVWQNKLTQLIQKQYKFQKLAQSELIQYLTPLQSSSNINININIVQKQKQNSLLLLSSNNNNQSKKKTDDKQKQKYKVNKTGQSMFSTFINMHSHVDANDIPAAHNRYEFQFIHCFEQVQQILRMATKIHSKKDKLTGSAIEQFKQFVIQKKQYLKNLKNGQNAVELIDRTYSSMSNLNFQSQGGDKQSFIKQVDLSILSTVYQFYKKGNQKQNDQLLLQHANYLHQMAKSLNKKYLTEQFSNLQIIVAKLHKCLNDCPKDKNLLINIQDQSQRQQTLEKFFIQFLNVCEINCKIIYQNQDTKMYLLTKPSQQKSYCKVILKQLNLEQNNMIRIQNLSEMNDLNLLIWTHLQQTIFNPKQMPTAKQNQKSSLNQFQQKVDTIIKLINAKIKVKYGLITLPLQIYKNYPLINQKQVSTYIQSEIKKLMPVQKLVKSVKIAQFKHYSPCWQLLNILNSIYSDLSQIKVCSKFYQVKLDDQLIIFGSTQKQKAVQFCNRQTFHNKGLANNLMTNTIQINESAAQYIDFSSVKVEQICEKKFQKEYAPLNKSQIMKILSLKDNNQLINKLKIQITKKVDLIENLLKFKRILALFNKTDFLNKKIRKLRDQAQLLQSLIHFGFSNSKEYPYKVIADNLLIRQIEGTTKKIDAKCVSSQQFRKISVQLDRCQIPYFKIIFGTQSKNAELITDSMPTTTYKNQNIIGIIQNNNLQAICQFFGCDNNKNNEKLNSLKQSLIFCDNNIILTNNEVSIQIFDDFIRSKIKQNLTIQELNQLIKLFDNQLVKVLVQAQQVQAVPTAAKLQLQTAKNISTYTCSHIIGKMFQKRQNTIKVPQSQANSYIKIEFYINNKSSYNQQDLDVIDDVRISQINNFGYFSSYECQFVKRTIIETIQLAKSNVKINNQKQEENKKQKQLQKNKAKHPQNNQTIFILSEKSLKKQAKQQDHKSDETQVKKDKNSSQNNSESLNLIDIMSKTDLMSKLIQKDVNEQQQKSDRLHNNDHDDYEDAPSLMLISKLKSNIGQVFDKQQQIKRIIPKNKLSATFNKAQIQQQEELMVDIDLSEGWDVQQTNFIHQLDPITKQKFINKQQISKLRLTQKQNKTTSGINMFADDNLDSLQVSQLSIVFSETDMDKRDHVIQFNVNQGYLHNFVNVEELINKNKSKSNKTYGGGK